jgi:hypothetical protein
MKAIIYNIDKSKLNWHLEGLSLRIAYLLCDEMISGGTTYKSISFHHYFSSDTVESKINLLKHVYERDANTELLGSIMVYQSQWQSLKKIKHLTSPQLVLKKQIEKNITVAFDNYKKWLLSELEQTGLPQLDKLYVDGQFAILPTAYGKPETEDEHFYAASSILMHKHRDVEEEEFFCLTPEFFSSEHMSNWKIAHAMSLHNGETKDGYLQHCFDFPHVNIMSTEELKAVCSNLKNPGSSFRSKVTEWIKMVYKGENYNDTCSFFSEQVLPLTKDVDSVLQSDELLKHVKRQTNNAVNAGVFFGEVTVKAIWDYYRTFKVIEDTTWEKMEKEASSFENKRWPVMAIMHASEEVPKEANQEEVMVKPVKKSLVID